MIDRLAELKAKLAARQGRGGFRANIAEIEAEIVRLEQPEPEQPAPPEPSAPLVVIPGRYRSAITGNFVTAEYAAANPDTTYRSGE